MKVRITLGFVTVVSLIIAMWTIAVAQDFTVNNDYSPEAQHGAIEFQVNLVNESGEPLEDYEPNFSVKVYDGEEGRELNNYSVTAGGEPGSYLFQVFDPVMPGTPMSVELTGCYKYTNLTSFAAGDFGPMYLRAIPQCRGLSDVRITLPKTNGEKCGTTTWDSTPEEGKEDDEVSNKMASLAEALIAANWPGGKYGPCTGPCAGTKKCKELAMTAINGLSVRKASAGSGGKKKYCISSDGTEGRASFACQCD